MLWDHAEAICKLNGLWTLNVVVGVAVIFIYSWLGHFFIYVYFLKVDNLRARPTST